MPTDVQIDQPLSGGVIYRKTREEWRGSRRKCANTPRFFLRWRRRFAHILPPLSMATLRTLEPATVAAAAASLLDEAAPMPARYRALFTLRNANGGEAEDALVQGKREGAGSVCACGGRDVGGAGRGNARQRRHDGSADLPSPTHQPSPRPPPPCCATTSPSAWARGSVRPRCRR